MSSTDKIELIWTPWCRESQSIEYRNLPHILVQRKYQNSFFPFFSSKTLFYQQKTTVYDFFPTFFYLDFFSKLNTRFNTSIWPNISPYQSEFGNSLLMISHPTFLHSITQSLLHSFFYSLIHSSEHFLQLTHPLSHLLTHLLANSCTNLSIHCFTYIS